jgi:hypothetical protein
MRPTPCLLVNICYSAFQLKLGKSLCLVHLHCRDSFSMARTEWACKTHGVDELKGCIDGGRPGEFNKARRLPVSQNLLRNVISILPVIQHQSVTFKINSSNNQVEVKNVLTWLVIV